jgi:hypothetical protein
MIGQYLPQTNESATVAKSKNFSELNKASFTDHLLLLNKYHIPVPAFGVSRKIHHKHTAIEDLWNFLVLLQQCANVQQTTDFLVLLSTSCNLSCHLFCFLQS